MPGANPGREPPVHGREYREGSARDWAARGEEAFQQAHYQEAVDCFKKALPSAPFDAKIHSDLSMALWEIGNVEEALARLSQALELDPDNQAVIRSCARVFRKLGKEADARDILEAYLERKPWDDEIQRELANLGAVSPGAALLSPPNVGNFFNAHGEDQFHRGRTAHARVCFEIALEHNPTHAKAHSNLGVVCWQEGSPQLALEHFYRALELDPGDADILINSSKALAAVGEMEAAREYMQLYLQRCPEDESTWKEYANLVEGMCASSWKADGLPDGVFDVYLLMGKELGAAGDLVGAGEAFLRCLQLNDRQAAPYYELARIHIAAGQEEEAVAMLNEALRVEPGHRASVLTLGEILSSRGLPEEAKGIE